MNWVIVIWSMAASACLTIALIHLVIWFKDRRSYIQLLFATAAVAVAGIAAAELLIMLAATPAEFGSRLRWAHVPIFFAIVSIVWYIRLYFQTGRLWLAWSVCAIRFLALVLNFVFSPNLNYREITSVRPLELAPGVTVARAEGVANPWTRVGELASILLLVFVLDASITLWRRGGENERRRALIVGGSIVLFIFIGAGHVALIHAGLIQLPYMISLAFLIPVIAMGYELGTDVVRSAWLVRELKLSQTELKESERRLDLAATAGDLGMWRWDIVRDEIWVNEKSRAMIGLDNTARIDLSRFLAALAPEDHDEVRQALIRSLDTGSDYEKEFRIRLRDGTSRWIAARGIVEFNSSHVPIVMRGVSFDITRRKQAEERFRLVVEAAPNSMIVVDRQGVITLVNKQTEVVFGYDREELIGKPIETLIPEPFRAAHETYRQGYTAAPQARSMGVGRELFGRRKDGSEVPVEIGLNPIQTAEGMLVLASIIDITERKQAEYDNMRQRNELAHLSRVAMLGELSGSLAHELNQPLTAILSNAQAAQEFLAQDSTNLDEVRGILQDIVDEDRRAREVIRRLRLLFRKGEIQFEALDLNELVLEVLSLMNSDLVNHGVTIQANLSPDLPRVKGDRVQLQQVLINLMVNASDAMSGNGDNERGLRMTTRLDEEGVVAMSIEDDGCGISSDQLEKIFEPFHTTKEKGMGLGLAVCRTIISAHGGKLWATNNREKGACFHVAFAPLSAGRP